MFDGSLTPPLSDISDCDAEAADNGDVRRENSPVLAAKRPKKSNKILKRKLSLDECTIISPRTNETECYCMISDLQFLTDIFYSASNFILYLEHKAIESNKIHPGFKCSDQDIKPVFRILDSFIKKFDGVNYKDQACHLIEKLDVLCGEVALVADIGPKHMHRLLSSKFRLSVEERNLHECGSHELVSWIHCFCDVNMYALKVTRVAKEKCAQLNIIEILHSSGMAVNDDHDLLTRTCSRILHQLFY
uniref:Uncharacterized protein n=1 Tax=Ciona savignyi TaxID=51511 RepID=H2YD52_CIOSA